LFLHSLHNNPQTQKNTLEIDWTVIDSNDSSSSSSKSPATVAITDSIQNVGEVQELPVNINWDISEDASSANTPTIDWGLESGDTTVSEITVNTGNIEIEVVEASSTSGAAKRDDSFLSDVTTRNLFIDDLLELREFLEQRKVEMEEKETGLSFHLFQTSSSNSSSILNSPMQIIQSKTVDDISNSLSSIEDILSSLENGRMRLLLEIKHSKRFVDRIVASFLHLLECVEKSKASITFAEQKKADLSNLVSETYPKLESLINRAKELKVNIEKTLMKQYPGRIVSLVGEVNNL